jgi:rhomboid family GlyGly-CTERM serine protease
LITGPLVHSDLGQAGRDISMLVLVSLVWERSFGARYLLLLLLCMIVPTAVAVALHFELGAYFGMSGAVNGLFTAALITDYRRSKSRLIAALLALHAAKLAYETMFGMLLPMELASGVTPLPEAHLAGAITGLGFSWAESLRASDIRRSLPAR